MDETPRPPTILGPYGEGYCRECQFVVGLDWRGLLDHHARGRGGGGAGTLCNGSGRRPPKVTPYSSRKAAFKVRGELVRCPACRRRDISLTTGGVMATHTVFVGQPGRVCLGSYKHPSDDLPLAY